MSALMAKELGAFPGYPADKANMLRVIRNHRHAAHGAARESSSYENLKIRPVPIDHKLVKAGRINIANSQDILARATKAWDEALSLGEKHGYRNAQVTVIAPTGTIGLLMDCDTTGVEPDFALVKFKKLAGGGYFKIANESVAPALKALGYSEQHAADIMTYLLGKLDLEVPMPEGIRGATEGHLFSEWLAAKGLSAADLDRITKALPSVFELSFAFGPWSIGDETLKRLGFDPAAAKADPTFNLLRKLGLKERQIEILNTAICGTQTVEGAPRLRAEHLPVFDCANKCGKIGQRFIAAEGHIRMMAAAQPFISGAISKTINLPTEATVSDIESCYRLSWELGLKANALYRDGCKLSQPLSSTSDRGVEDEAEEEADAVGESESARREAPASGAAPAVAAISAEPVRVEVVVQKPMRRRLPDTRRSLTHKFNVAGHEGYLTVGLYEDGKPGELFITMAKEGSTTGGLMDSLGTATSVALQYGVPVESLVNKFSHQRFEPAGMTTNQDIPFAKSLVDYIFRWMGMQFIPGYRAANAPQRSGAAEGGESHSNGAGRASVTEEQTWRSAEVKEWQAERSTLAAGRGHDEADGGSGLQGSIAGMKPVAPSAAHSSTVVSIESRTLTIAMESMGDAPACDVCGTITVRSGTCYKCVNCGNSMGCS
jgi:ribonucleoside-diphosphate reductase alpha chain